MKWLSRKLLVALVAIGACVLKPAAAAAVASIAVAFFGAHAVADSKFGRADAVQAGD